MAVRHALAVVTAAAAVLVVTGSSSAAPQVRHGSVRLTHPGPGRLVLDIWRDASNGEFAFRLRGGHDLTILRKRTIFDVIDGGLADTTLYSSGRNAWSVISARFGVTQARTNSILAAGETVTRPKPMTVPKPNPDKYTFSRDFGTDLAALRHAARFAVPSPGRRLDGRALWDVSLNRTHTANLESGPVGVIIYSNNRSGADQVLLNVAPAGSGDGAIYADFFARSHRPVGGQGLKARLIDRGEAILRYHGSYVLVQLDGRVTAGRWRAVLGRIARP